MEKKLTATILKGGFRWRKVLAEAEAEANYWGQQGYGVQIMEIYPGWFRLAVMIVMTCPPPSEQPNPSESED